MNRIVRFCLPAVLLLTAVSLFAQQNAPVRAKAFETAPDITYDSVPNFLKLPANLYLGEGIGVARNSKGHVFVFTRSGETRLFEFDQNGNFVREIGQGLYGFQMAHGVRVDPQDNIWTIDEGTNVIVKFSPEGRVLMTMGRREEAVEGILATPAPGTPPPPAQPYRFNRPTDITWDPAGNIFVSDGYGNSRVAKYDKNGRFLKSIGSRGTQPGQMNTPHSITADAKGNIYVADRGNRRIQVFDSDLNLLKIFDNVGAPWAVCITPGAHQYLYSSNSNPDNNDSRQMAVSGEIYKMELDGTIIGKFGKPGKQLGEFSTVHEIDCRNENELVVAEITAWRIQKLVLKSPRIQTSSRSK
ncbi:MAG TPA: peptidyl-alpha-hydroxyglycine alpha-amidating lyase family protein [Terriglobia bacterium]|nr:peptidyl-alpha-hydroxyglycine alpha-amidating lyase family protein [Terriglobia bacterium]